MAKVSLRIYNREIEGMVDSGQLDEAIAHCRHILNAFPKNLETYRLLGKAYLESKRYGEATDIFERVLMAVPDDFVSHVGMSIINDEQKDMDAAIWHMERAFEVQPSNTAIQAELQRLYGRRDGVEPPKIRLTRGALAHMYVQGELYAQAISEIKSVLEDDPNRQDMQVLLARAHFHAGQQSEAAEMCSQLLRRYPYCLDANRVLIELLPQSERGESTQVYRHRLSELDPYSTFATGSVFHTEEVADAAVNLERLDWDGQPVDIQPGWSDSLGITKGDSPAAPGSAEPDWLKSGLTEDASSLTGEPAPVSGGLPIPTADDGIEEDIPDFLREAGWGQSTGAFQEGPGTFDASDDGADDGSAAEALAAGDLPDWVKAMAPEGADSESSMPQAAAANLADDLMGDDVPDWLQGIGDEQDETPAKEPTVPDSAGELPDWLDEMKPEGEPAPASQAQPAETPAGGEDGLPDWLDEMKSADVPTSEPQLQETVEPADEDGMPDWLDEMKSVDMPESEPQTDAEPAADGELPDWLEEMREESPAQEQEEPVESVSSDFGASAQEQDDAVAWLESLASKHGAKDEELVTDPSTRKETAPEWIQKAQQEAEQEQAVTEPEPEMLTMQEESPEMEESVAEEEEPVTSKGSLGTSAQEQDDAVAWLESLASKHGAKAEELVTDPSARKDTAPEWVQKAQQEAEQAVTEPEPEPEEPGMQEEEITPASLADWGDTGGQGTTAQEQDDAVAWLESLASKHGAKDEELVTDPSTRKDTAPEWVQKAQQEAEQAQAVTEPEPEMPTMEEVPLAIEEAVSEEEPVTSKGSLGTSAQEQDDAVAWLESLASKHGAKAEELVTDPSVRKDTAPEWVQKALQEAEQEQAESELVHQVDESAPAMEEPAPAEEEEPEWMKHAKEVGESLFSELEDAQTKEPIPSEDIDETGMWLQDLEKEPEPEATESTADEDISEWLAGLDDSESEPEAVPETEAVSEPVSEAEPVVSTPVEEPVQETGTGDDLPSWLGGLEEEKQAEPVSDSGEDLPDWSSEEAEPEPTVLEPTTPEDWKPADAVAPEPEPEPELKQKTVPQPPAEPERVAYREPVTRSRSGMTGMLSAAQDPLLVQAQNELIRSNIPAAMENYTKLIKKGKMLDEVIFDLREALYRFPVEVSILQTLGDAYMRANRIQDALDAYTKAEELLR